MATQEDIKRFTKALGTVPDDETLEFLLDLEHDVEKQLSVEEIQQLMKASTRAVQEKVPVNQEAKLVPKKELKIKEEVLEAQIKESLEDDENEEDVVLPVGKKNVPKITAQIKADSDGDKLLQKSGHKTTSRRTVAKQGAEVDGDSRTGSTSRPESPPPSDSGGANTNNGGAPTNTIRAAVSPQATRPEGVIPSNLSEEEIQLRLNVFMQHLMRVAAYQEMSVRDPRNAHAYNKQAECSKQVLGNTAIALFDGDISVTRILKTQEVIV